MKNIFAVIVAGIILIVSCQKNEVKEQEKVAKPVSSASILGKWKVEELNSSIISKNISPFISSYRGTEADYYDFRDNGYVYMKLGMKQDSMSYTITGNSIITRFRNLIIDTMTIDITSKRLTLSLSKELPFDQTYSKTQKLIR